VPLCWQEASSSGQQQQVSLSNKAAKRAAAAAPLAPAGPVVVREPATAAEAAEVEAWKAERRSTGPQQPTWQRRWDASGELHPELSAVTALLSCYTCNSAVRPC